MEQDRLCMGCMKEKVELTAICQNCGFEEGKETESPLFLAPRTLLEDKYLIGRVLGQGGFGITYLALDLNLNIKLAIKEFFPQDMATRAAGLTQVNPYSGSIGSQYEYGLDKFLQEARTLAQFEGHPNIVSIRDFFRANGTAYFVMSYVEGITLQKYLADRGGRLAVNQALGIIMPVLDALKVVHAAEVLHRDISPDNIYINQRGQVILIDFGAARQAIGEKDRSLSIILKPGYAPEEQYRSKGIQGPWTDIYAVAATTYHLITGLPPVEALERLGNDQLLPPSKMDVDIGEREEKALIKALAVRGTDRYQSVQDFQVDLLGESSAASIVAPDRPVKSEELKETQPTAKPAFSVKNIIGIAAAVVLVAGSVVLFSMLTDDKPEIAVQEESIIETEGNQNEAETAPLLETIKEEEEEILTDIEENQESADSEKAQPVSAQIPEPVAQPAPAPAPPPAPAPASEQEVQNMPYEGGLYTGSLKNGIPHGQGKWTHPQGLLYIGEFTDGSVTGYGNLTLPSGDQYVGMVNKGIPNGQGKLTKTDGTVLEGYWVDGNLQ